MCPAGLIWQKIFATLLQIKTSFIKLVSATPQWGTKIMGKYNCWVVQVYKVNPNIINNVRSHDHLNAECTGLIFVRRKKKKKTFFPLENPVNYEGKITCTSQFTSNFLK